VNSTARSRQRTDPNDRADATKRLSRSKGRQLLILTGIVLMARSPTPSRD